MKHSLSSLRGWSVTNHRSGEHLGSIGDVVLDASNGKLIAFDVRQGFLFVRRRYLAPCDIQRWGDTEVLVEGASALIRPEDEPRLGAAILHAFPWVGLTVRTPTGRSVGAVQDLILEGDFGSVLTLIVEQKLFGIVHLDERRIPVSHILEVTRDGVVIDDVELGRPRTRVRRAVRQLFTPMPVRGPSDSPSLPARAR